MKLGSLFDGSGGFPLAGSLCGIEPRWAAEVEPYPIAVTRSRFPNMKHLGSVTDINGAEIEPVNVITFGSPCQDLSVAGKRAGLKHEANGDDETTRSGLFMEAVRIIKEMREATNGRCPDFVLWENVPGAFSSNNGEDFRTVLAELIRIVEPNAAMPPVPKGGWAYADSYTGDGWSLAYRVFDAQYWGVPQRRRRIHLVLDLRGERAREVLFEREGLRGYFAQGGEPGQGTATDAEGGFGADDRKGKCFEPRSMKEENWAEQTAKNALRAGASKSSHAVVVPRAFQNTGIGWWNESDIGTTLRTPCGGDATFANVVVWPTCIVDSVGGKAERGWVGDIAPCLKASHYKFPPTVIYDARGNGDGKTSSTLVGAHENRVTDYTSVVVEPIPIQDKATRYKGGGSTRNNDGAGNGLGVGNPGDSMNTLTSADRHAVAYVQTYQKVTGPLMANTHPGSYSGQDAYSDMLICGVDCRNINESPELYPTLQAKPNGGHSLNFSHAVRIFYIVRRLTPTECARLQGFADRWGWIDEKDSLTAEEYQFWLDVRNTHAAINGKAVKQYTVEQMLKWYNKLHTDSAEYKMWGNGIALPPALYCMQGIADALNRERS